MKRFAGLAVLTLLLLGCSTAFGQINLGFLSSDMSTLYCDYESLEFGGFLAAGIHVNADCGPIPDGVMIGYKDTLTASNLPLTGTVYVMNDSEFDAFCDCFTGDQAMFVTLTKPYNIHSPQIGWEVLFNTYDAFYAYLDNWGYLVDPTVAPVVNGKAKSKSKENVSFKPLTYAHSVM